MGVAPHALRIWAARVVALVLLCLVVEASARLLHASSYVYDSARGYVTAPGVVRYSDESFAASRWQEGGVRRSAPWSSAEPRIIALGDSFTEAFMVSDSDVYTARLEERLRQSGHSVQVLNLGRSTQSVADYIDVAQVLGERFAPTWTIVQARSVDFGEDAWHPDGAVRPVFDRRGHELVVNHAVQPPRTGRARPLWEARQRSMAVGWAATRLGEVVAAARGEPPLFRAGSVQAKPPHGTSALEGDYPLEEEVDLLFRAYGGRLTLLFVADLDPSHPAVPDALERRVLEHCRRIGVSCVGVRDQYPALVAEGVSPFGFSTSWYNFGHANGRGHALFADALAAELIALGPTAFSAAKTTRD